MTTDFPTDRAIRWAVLMAYARNLPTALERVTVRNQAQPYYPGFGNQGQALVLAREAGLLHNAEVTQQGRHQAEVWLGLLQEESTVTTPQDDILAAFCREVVAFYDRLLDTPGVQQGTNVQHIRDLRETISLLNEETTFSRDAATVLLLAQRHLSEGVSAEELGLPVSEEYQEAKATVTRNAGEMLLSQMGDYSPEVRRIVQDLAEGILPFRNEIPVLLAALLEVGRRPRTLTKAEA